MSLHLCPSFVYLNGVHDVDYQWLSSCMWSMRGGQDACGGRACDGCLPLGGRDAVQDGEVMMEAMHGSGGWLLVEIHGIGTYSFLFAYVHWLGQDVVGQDAWRDGVGRVKRMHAADSG